jgi:hypothetical protein
MNIIDIFSQLLEISLQFGFQVHIIIQITLNLAIVTADQGILTIGQ